MTYQAGDAENPWDSGSNEAPRRSALVPVMIGCGVLVVLALGVFAAGIIWLVNSPESGVKMANEMDAYALNYLARHKVLNRTERLVAYYDVTTSMSGTEAAVLTTERVIYHKDGRTTAIPLRDVIDVRHRYETLGGDIIEVVGRGGDQMKIEIAPLNGGETFLNALNDARRQATAAEDPPPPDEAPGPGEG